jgi:hypothetical protein
MGTNTSPRRLPQESTWDGESKPPGFATPQRPSQDGPWRGEKHDAGSPTSIGYDEAEDPHKRRDDSQVTSGISMPKGYMGGASSAHVSQPGMNPVAQDAISRPRLDAPKTWQRPSQQPEVWNPQLQSFAPAMGTAQSQQALGVGARMDPPGLANRELGTDFRGGLPQPCWNHVPETGSHTAPVSFGPSREKRAPPGFDQLPKVIPGSEGSELVSRIPLLWHIFGLFMTPGALL